MNTQQHLSATEATAYVRAAQPEQTLFTVKQFPQVEPAFTEAALRNIIFKADSRLTSRGEIPGNGLVEAGAIVRVGRKVLIHRAKFLAHLERMPERRELPQKATVSTPKRSGRAAMGAAA